MKAEYSPPGDASLQQLIAYVVSKVKNLLDRTDEPVIIVSPYRMNPLGAHIDHQGGSVLARTINQYTILAFYPVTVGRVVLHCDDASGSDKATVFDVGHATADENWVRYATASAAAFKTHTGAENGFSGLVYGSLVGAGLSSSASVILAYICGMAQVNTVQLTSAELVELTRQVENEFMGLNNGLQDQMSVVFGQANALSLLDMNSVTATYIDDPATIEEVCWVICYSGFSRELVSSGFNHRVRECREAAVALDNQATHLGEVAIELRSQKNIDQLPPHLGRRAMHVYSEMERVEQGCDAWRSGDWEVFGNLMNLSCHSSIHQYECGSEAMIDLHKIALQQNGVYGSRFGGGGYGGCLMMLVDKTHVDRIKINVLTNFLERYPEKNGTARTFIARAENNVRRQANQVQAP